MPLDPDAVTARLPGRNILWLESTDSTMLDAARLAAAGCPQGSVVGAEEQLEGQGRLGRRWHSEREAGLYFTVVLRPGAESSALPVVTLALGVAVAEAIERVTGFHPDLRWPNDVLLEERKCAGILTQLHNSAVLAGIGINVNHEQFPDDLADLATSLRIATDHWQSREDLLVETLSAIDRAVALLNEQGKAAIIERFTRASSYVSGKRVIVDQGTHAAIGVTDGLDESGFLRLRQDDGTRSVIMAGGVRPWRR
jgi:BirA family biotin operon repressor/biotin-[acetyl-CoA-carboxylase] ligase